MTPATRTHELTFPLTWRKESRERFQRLADMGRITQDDIDGIESVLVWFRNVRDEYAQNRRDNLAVGSNDGLVKKGTV